MAASKKFVSQYTIVVDLSIENNAQISPLVEHRLLPGDQIDDAQASVPETDA